MFLIFRNEFYFRMQFEDARDAEDAIRGRDGYNFDGNRLRVRPILVQIACVLIELAPLSLRCKPSSLASTLRLNASTLQSVS